jgi:hypothetical protein
MIHRTMVLMGAALMMGGFVSCSGDEPSSSTSQLLPTSGPSSAEPWDLLYISDSSGWRVGEAYARLASEELGVEVRLIDWRVGGLSMVQAIDKIAADPQTVADAEIIVLWANPVGSGVRDDHCFAVTANSPAPEPLTADEWAPFGALFEQAFADIWAARDGDPVVLRATDLYVPVLDTWEEFGATDACTASFVAMSDAVRSAAEASGATMVSAYDALNGPNHDVDIAQAGYLRDDFHLNEAGGTVVGEALAAEGFVPSPAP